MIDILRRIVLSLLLVGLAACSNSSSPSRDDEEVDDGNKQVCDIIEVPDSSFDSPMFVAQMDKTTDHTIFCGRSDADDNPATDYLEFFAQEEIRFSLLARRLENEDTQYLPVMGLYIWDENKSKYVGTDTFVGNADEGLDIIKITIPQGFFMLTHRNLLSLTVSYSLEFWGDV
jgi:hypothetical protein